jgi:putative PIN family toxin of toxin-antitoxin system
MSPDAPGAVFDCNILLQAVIGRGPAFDCVALVGSGRFTLYTSPETLAEAREVLCRPKIREKFAGRLTDAKVDELLGHLGRHSAFIADVPKVFSLGRDPKDEAYINLALVAGAAYIVSRDKDLLDLMNEGNVEGQALRALSPLLRVADPVRFLTAVAPPPSEASPS